MSEIACCHRLAALTLAVLVMFDAPGEAQAEDGTYGGMTVSVVDAARECFRNLLPVSGVLVPKSEIAVRPERDGLMVGNVLAEPGDNVLAGQILARLVAPAGAPPATAAVQSPVAGVAIGVPATVGTYASPKAPDPMFRIIEGGELELRGQALMATLPLLHSGQSATIDIMGLEKLKGRVTSIDAKIDAMTQMGTVRLSVGSDPRLKPGSFARAEIDAGEVCQTAVPLSAVLYGPEGAVVQVVMDGHVETRRVAIGLTYKGRVQISNGIDPADKVIALSGGFLREGDRVRSVSVVAPMP